MTKELKLRHLKEEWGAFCLFSLVVLGLREMLCEHKGW